MDVEARRLKVLIETNTLVLEELRRLEDPALSHLIRELERARADAAIQLAQLRAEERTRQPPPQNDTTVREPLPEDPTASRQKPAGRATTRNTPEAPEGTHAKS